MVVNRSRTLVVLAALSAGVAFASVASAQDTPLPAEPAIEAPAVSDEKLDSFALAFLEVERIKQEYAQQLQQAQSQTEQQQIQNDAGAKMLQAVEATEGITVEEYNQIIQSAQADAEFAQRLSSAINQANQ